MMMTSTRSSAGNRSGLHTTSLTVTVTTLGSRLQSMGHLLIKEGDRFVVQGQLLTVSVSVLCSL